VALALVPAGASAADAELWTTLTARGSIRGPVLGEADFVARFSHDDGGLYEARVGGFLGYKMTDRVSLWVGYTRLNRYADGRVTSTEDRPREQITADLGHVLGATVSGRLRLEQRLRSGGGVGWRVRPQIRASWPIGKAGLALFAAHESFVALNDTASGQRSGYERMRNSAGVTLPLSRQVKAELGYLNQYSFRSGRPDAVDHVGSLALSYAF